MTQKDLRKSWHSFFIRNKHRFTDDLNLVKRDKNKIYVPIEKTLPDIRQPQIASDIQYNGHYQISK